jgi:hypothetical protein
VLHRGSGGLIRFGLHETDAAGPVQRAPFRSRDHCRVRPLVRARTVKKPEGPFDPTT